MKIRNQKSGFTLLESLVAVSLLALSITIAFTIAPEGISATRLAKNHITAVYLGQEAIEIVRNRRDTDMYYGDYWLDYFVNDNDFLDKQLMANGATAELIECAGECDLVDLVRVKDTADGPLYGNGSDFTENNSEATIFRRVVEIKRVMYNPNDDPEKDDGVDINDREIQVTARMTWQDLGREREVLIQENLFRWWPPF